MNVVLQLESVVYATKHSRNKYAFSVRSPTVVEPDMNFWVNTMLAKTLARATFLKFTSHYVKKRP